MGFRLREAIKFQEEQALQYPLKKLGSDFIGESVGESVRKQRQKLLTLGVIPVVGVGFITFFVTIRMLSVHSNTKLINDTKGKEYNIERIEAVESLVGCIPEQIVHRIWGKMGKN